MLVWQPHDQGPGWALVPRRYHEIRDGAPSPKAKPPRLRGPREVAGAGFEPATFGL